MSAPESVPSPLSAALAAAVLEVSPPDLPDLPQGASDPDAPTTPAAPNPWATIVRQPAGAPAPKSLPIQAPPPGLTLWLEPCPPPPAATTVAQALWYALFEAHRSTVLANLRAAIDDELQAIAAKAKRPAQALSEPALLSHLVAQQPFVSAIDPMTGEMALRSTTDLPLNLGLGYLRMWAQPQLLPAFVQETFHALAQGDPLPERHALAAKEFFEYVLMQLSSGEHFFDIALTSGVPVHALMKFVRAYSDGFTDRQAKLQQALDDGVDVATAAFSRLADSLQVSDEMLERAKQSLVARRDLVLRLQDSRYAPPAAAARASMRATMGGMQIDFTFDTSAQAPKPTFLDKAPSLKQANRLRTPPPTPSITDAPQ